MSEVPLYRGVYVMHLQVIQINVGGEFFPAHTIYNPIVFECHALAGNLSYPFVVRCVAAGVLDTPRRGSGHILRIGNLLPGISQMT